MKLLKSNKSLVTGNKGQVALFVALIFQVLFLFFAMIVNVGLVVHHKINLQSSVDMAAYYGAMKQAELLNTIGHMNYQMRQSWKLLAWRYRVLGAAGDNKRHPYKYDTPKIIKPDMDLEYFDDNQANFSQPPFCITYSPFNETVVPEKESTCKLTLDTDIGKQVITLIKRPPPIIAGFIGLARATKAITENMMKSSQDRCYNIGPYNYLILGYFMLAYQIDQNARKTVIARISKDMSKNKQDFIDIEGYSVKDGAFETFKRNLTEANKASSNLSFELFNGLAHDGCGVNPVDNSLEYPAPWLSENRIFPSIYYLDAQCRNGADLEFKVKNYELVVPENPNHPSNNSSMPWAFMTGNTTAEMNRQIKYVANYLNLYSDQYRFILGYEKNPWCMAYVGAKATSSPKIPFAPSNLTFTAKAFAKPFGGRIGPWYYKVWNKGSTESTGSINDRTDNLVPLRIKDTNTLLNDPNLYGSELRIANYSKYIGDNFGLRSWRTLAYYSRALFSLPANPNYRTLSNPITPTDQKIISQDPKALRLEDWYHIAQTPDLNPEKDVLAWNTEGDKPTGMRMLEIAGIAPDQFDLAYYSIEPNFYDNYYNKIKNGILKKIGLDESYLRPDLGARIGDKTYEKFSIKDQIKITKDISNHIIDFKTKLTYNVLNPVHLLTSWTNKSLFNYEEVPEGYFGECQSPKISKSNYIDPQDDSNFLKKGESVPGECVTGGRTGYSVKLISRDLLFSPVRAGGASTAESIILNPPSNF